MILSCCRQTLQQPWTKHLIVLSMIDSIRFGPCVFVMLCMFVSHTRGSMMRGNLQTYWSLFEHWTWVILVTPVLSRLKRGANTHLEVLENTGFIEPSDSKWDDFPNFNRLSRCIKRGIHVPCSWPLLFYTSAWLLHGIDKPMQGNTAMPK